MLRKLLLPGLMLSWMGCAGGGDQAQMDKPLPAAPLVDAMRVETAVLGETAGALVLQLPGEVEGARDALLGSALGGYVEEVLTDEGRVVSAGQVLVRVDTRMYAVALKQAEANRDLAVKELERAEGLGDKLSQANLDKARLAARQAELAVESAQVMVSKADIRAPFSGTVAQLNVEVGEILGPGAPVVRVVRMDPVKITLAVSDRDVVALKEGQEVRIGTDAEASIATGRIKHIGTAADLRTRAFMVEVEADNRERKLMPGMIARVLVQADLAGGALVVPQDYLVTRIDGLGVFLNVGGKAVWKPVKTGAVVGDQVQVLEGLDTGAEVVVTGHRSLAEGDALLVARSGRCCEAGRTVFAE